MQVKKHQLELDRIIDWFKLQKRARQGSILWPCLFNLYAEYILWHAGLDETQSGIKIAFRNINNLRYTDDTIFMAEIEEDLKSFSMQVKEESKKAVLNLSIQKVRSWIWFCHFMANRWRKKWKHWETLFSWAPKPVQTVTAAMKLIDTCFLEEKRWQT